MTDSRSYCAVATDIQAAGLGKYIARVSAAQPGVLLSPPAPALLQACRSSAAWETLIERGVATLDLQEEPTEEIGAVIDQLRQHGLVVALDELLPPESVGLDFTQPITTIAIPTADRPDQCKRTLASAATHVRARGRSVTYIVMDDSRSTGQIPPESADVVSGDDRMLRWAGADERTRYAEELARAGIDPEAARFALLGAWPEEVRTTGAVRNAILLDTIGERVLALDDDVICQFARHPRAAAGLRLQGHSAPRDYWFFADRSEALHEACWNESCDLLGEHEALLGLSLQDAAAKARPFSLKIEHACQHVLSGLNPEARGRVVATMAGVVGDSGAYAASPWLTLRGVSFQRLVESETALANATVSREMLGVAPMRTITHAGSCQAMCLGLANDTELPPFFPIGRNSDGVFGNLVHYKAPQAFLAHLPVAILHAPKGERRYRPLTDFRISELILAIFPAVMPPHRRGSADFLHHLGSELLYLSGQPEAVFWETVGRAATSFECGRLRGLESAMQAAPNAPAFWVRAVRATHEKLVERMIASYWFIPCELRDQDINQAKLRTRELARLAGLLFYHWTDIREAARLLRKQGTRISLDRTPVLAHSVDLHVPDAVGPDIC